MVAHIVCVGYIHHDPQQHEGPIQLREGPVLHPKDARLDRFALEPLTGPRVPRATRRCLQRHPVLGGSSSCLYKMNARPHNLPETEPPPRDCRATWQSHVCPPIVFAMPSFL